MNVKDIYTVYFNQLMLGTLQLHKFPHTYVHHERNISGGFFFTHTHPPSRPPHPCSKMVKIRILLSHYDEII